MSTARRVSAPRVAAPHAACASEKSRSTPRDAFAASRVVAATCRCSSTASVARLASTSNRAAIAEAALKDSQQIVSRQHDALEQTSERLRLNDQQLDLMRNALHRRDELLGSQLSSGEASFAADAPLKEYLLYTTDQPVEDEAWWGEVPDALELRHALAVYRLLRSMPD